MKSINKNVVMLGIVSYFTDFASAMITPILPIFVVTVLHEGMDKLGLIVAVATFISYGLRVFSGYIADRFYDHPSRKLNLIGVTGTNGKTSCTHFIAQLLSRLGFFIFYTNFVFHTAEIRFPISIISSMLFQSISLSSPK